MTKLSFSQLENFVSTQRLRRYALQSNHHEDNAVALYLKNLDTSKECYALLHWLEIGLRNRINSALCKGYGVLWFENQSLQFEPIEQQQITQAKQGLLKQRKPIDNGRVIASLHFGFWVNLYNSPYEELWRKHLRRAFPAQKEALARKTIRIELGHIHQLRNRIAHYEPIIDHDVLEAKRRITQLIAWMDAPEIVTMLQPESHFNP